eukprot:gene30630-37008_t
MTVVVPHALFATFLFKNDSLASAVDILLYGRKFSLHAERPSGGPRLPKGKILTLKERILQSKIHLPAVESASNSSEKPVAKSAQPIKKASQKASSSTVPSIAKEPTSALTNKQLSSLLSELPAFDENRPVDLYQELEAYELYDDDRVGTQPHKDFRSGFVSIIGNPNVGKSTLLNQLLGQKISIVSNKPQTTRQRIKGIHTDDNVQVVFLDTPGMIEPAYSLQESMSDAVRSAVGGVDAIMLVTDIFTEPLKDAKILNRLQAIDAHNRDPSTTSATGTASTSTSVTSTNTPIFIVINKMDIYNKYLRREDGGWEQVVEGGESAALGRKEVWRTYEEMCAYWKSILPTATILPVSARLGTNTSSVIQQLTPHLPHGPLLYPPALVTDKTERWCVSEIIRESIFHVYKDELPYSTEVVINDWKDRGGRAIIGKDRSKGSESNDRTAKGKQEEKASSKGQVTIQGPVIYIEADVVVEKESQKMIVIGAKGQMLKSLGSRARERVEEFLGRKVYLSLNVKVERDWREKKEMLSRFGYLDE